MKLHFLLFPILLLFVIQLSGQKTNDNGDFIVDFKPFSPPEQDILREMIGAKAMNFQSKDLKGVTHSLSAYQGERVILSFWSTENINTPDLQKYLDLLGANADLTILTYCYENREEANAYLVQHPMNAVVMPQGKFLGEIGYGHGLGLPRMFFIGKDGVIKDILPSSAFQNNPNLYPIISDIVSKAF